MKTLENNLSHRALLVSVNISQWSARKLDKRATQSVTVAHNTKNGAGNYTKKLLPEAIELEKIVTITGQVRKYYYDQTLPWLSDGTRILSGKNYLNFQSELYNLTSLFNSAVNEFSAAYPTLRQNAANLLGDLYSIDDYPSDISDRFKITTHFLPLPNSSDFRLEVSTNDKKAFEQKMREVENAAMLDASNRLYSVIKNAIEKLNDNKSIFRDSLLDNIREIADLMPNLNLSENSQLDQLSTDAKNLIDSIDIKTIRTDKVERDNAKNALSDIESRMGAFMGVFK